MGFKLKRSEYELTRFVAFAAKKNQSFITIDLALAWANRSKIAKQITRESQLSIIRTFARYLIAEDKRTQVPGLRLIPKPPLRRSKPYVYTDIEIDKLIEATKLLNGKFRQYTYKTLFSLLAVTGMRVGEAIRLDRKDFYSNDGLLVVRDTKFGKSREVVLHKSAVEALQKYVNARDCLFKRPDTDAFFLSTVEKRLLYENVNRVFIEILGPAGLKTTKPNRPRLHDLRHTFVIRSLIQSYKSGQNSEKRLYELSTYLGHSSPANTYWYLTAVPELLAEGMKKLEKMTRRS
jgi:integrase